MIRSYDIENVAVLLPCLNEEISIGDVVDSFRKNLPQAKVYVFDNLSTDHTAEVALKHGAIVVPSLRRGKGNVVRHMFESVEADVYLMADGDGTYPASEAPQLLREFHRSGADMLVGIRVEDFANSAFRRFHLFGNHLVAKLISSLFRVRVTDVMSGYRVFSKDFVKTIPLLSSGFEIETEMTLQAAAKGYNIVERAIPYGKRPEGSFSKLNTFTDGALVLKSILMIFKDFKPLYFFGFLSSCFALTSLAVGASPILDYARTRFVSHVPLAILAAALGILAAMTAGVGLILDTVAKNHRENFVLWRKSIQRGGVGSAKDLAS